MLRRPRSFGGRISAASKHFYCCFFDFHCNFIHIFSLQNFLAWSSGLSPQILRSSCYVQPSIAIMQIFPHRRAHVLKNEWRLYPYFFFTESWVLSVIGKGYWSWISMQRILTKRRCSTTELMVRDSVLQEGLFQSVSLHKIDCYFVRSI